MRMTVLKRRLGLLAMSLLWSLVFGVMLLSPATAKAAAQSGAVYVIPVKQQIEQGLGSFLERAFQEAKEMNAGLIVLEIDTPGGRVDTAGEIGTLLQETDIPTVAFIRGDAASAGSYIALNADKIAMAPGSMIGSASMVDGMGNPVEDAKLVSWWKAQMVSAAESSGRNEQIAAGMADPKVAVELTELGRTVEAGDIVALSAEEALKVGYSDTMAGTVNEVIEFMGFSGNEVFEMELTFSEKLASFLTNPFVMTLLLFMGIAGVLIELIVPGFGIPGVLGITGFVLYFFGNSVAGFAGMETWLLFVIGIALLAMELFVPSFGILGVIGSISLIFGVVQAAYTTTHVAWSLGIAAVCALIAIVVVALVFKERGIWNKFILSDSLSRENGYIPVQERDILIGLTGITLTPLRPSGTADIGGQRMDVVTAGGFIPSGSSIRVLKTDGTRIVVEQVPE
ncbi:nodulation protein NfeD [Paenibacillus sp. F411]|uniref:NfeD family protein n=1 Tax=Paenibacillus sp. F411 TaxID=2820239 RepID=UPI001AAFF039|nr:nodulation protein NfeD [Paenibacillus sp. F411]MBO2943261.1 nodulation protein NfeD [Paenibacillus sp. F411]